MILLLVLSVVFGQLHVLGVAWLGPLVPDPFVVLAAYAGLHGSRGALLPSALVLGWGRALVAVEPVGAHVLCAALALAVVSTQREILDRGSVLALLLGSVLVAGTWSASAWALGQLSVSAPGFGLSLLTGALLALPLAAPARAVARLTGRTA